MLFLAILDIVRVLHPLNSVALLEIDVKNKCDFFNGVPYSTQAQKCYKNKLLYTNLEILST